MHIVMRRVEDIVPYAKNAKKHDKKQIANVAESIRQYGFVQPVVIDRDGVIVIGHCRVLAAKQLKTEEVPCVCVDELTPEQVNALRIVDNKSNESPWDFDLLSLELPELDLAGFDFDFGIDLDIGGTSGEVVEDEPPEIDEENEPITKLGDIWQLGRHRLMCGDSTERQSVERLINGANIDMVFTDPPYDMEMGGQGCFKKSMDNCKDRIDDIIRFDPYVLSYLPELDIHSFYVFTSKNGIVKYLDIFKNLNYDILCWCKTNPVPFTSGSFLPDVEYLLYFSRKGRIWNNSLKPTSVYKKYYVTQKLQGRIDGGGDLHPTMKPTEIVADKVRINSNKDGIVLDIFGGSGTTLAVCEQIDRTCYTMELNPRYCDVIIKRWENMTGEKARLING